MSIRLACKDDARAVLEIYGPFCNTPVSFEAGPPTVSEMQRRIRQTLAGLPWLVETDADSVRGFAYAGPHRSRQGYQWSVEVSAYVRAGWRGQGLGRSLYTSLFEILRLQGFYNAYAGIALPNAASVALHEAMGFRSIGIYHGVGYKAGAWRDVGWWELALRERGTDPAPPRDLPRLAASSDWPASLARLPPVRSEGMDRG